jgi:hypothetical protein
MRKGLTVKKEEKRLTGLLFERVTSTAQYIRTSDCNFFKVPSKENLYFDDINRNIPEDGVLVSFEEKKPSEGIPKYRYAQDIKEIKETQTK